MRVPSGSSKPKLAASESAPSGWASSPGGGGARSGGAKVKDLLARYQQQQELA